MKLLLCLYLSLLTFKNVSSTSCYASDIKALMLGKPAHSSVQDCQSYLQEVSKFKELEEILASAPSMPNPPCFVSTVVLKSGKTTVINGCGSCDTFNPILTEIVKRLEPTQKFREIYTCNECSGDECKSAYKQLGATKEKLFVFNIVLLLFVLLLI